MRAGMVGLAALYWPIALGRALHEHPGVQFLGAATLGADERLIHETLGLTPQEYSQRFGVHLYVDAEEMVRAERLDTVVIVSRHTEHAVWVERMAGLDVDIFIPKTFATTLADADRIVAAGRRHDVRVAVGPSARFLPAMLAVKQALDAGRIGRPFAMRLCHHHGTIDVFHPNDWYRDPDEGGPELSLGWYGVDLVLHLMGESVETVAAQYGNFTSPDSSFMDCGRIEMRLASGALAAFDMYFCNRVPYPSWQLEVVGTEGVLSIHRAAPDSAATAVGLDGPNGYERLSLPERAPGWESFWIDDFLRGAPPAVTAEDARRITLITLAARTAAQTGAPVTISRGGA
jgi:predicted dehydrogenase